MFEDESLFKALEELRQNGVSQAKIASQAGLAQPHVSRLLREPAGLGSKARQGLWKAVRALRKVAVASHAPVDVLNDRLMGLPKDMRDQVAAVLIQVMEITLRRGTLVGPTPLDRRTQTRASEPAGME